jgi:hypothetical protein
MECSELSGARILKLSWATWGLDTFHMWCRTVLPEMCFYGAHTKRRKKTLEDKTLEDKTSIYKTSNGKMSTVTKCRQLQTVDTTNRRITKRRHRPKT